MPTFNSPTADAAEASEALRGLAHATRVFEDPADTYAVLGDLLAGVRSFHQVFDQLATAHARNQVRAYDDAGNQGAGASHALTAAARLRQAAVLLDGVHEQVDAAMSASGRIAWRSARPPEPDIPFLCIDVTARNLRVPEGAARRHANGVTGVAGVTVAVQDLATSVARYRALLGQEPIALGGVPGLGFGIVQFRIGRQTLSLAEPRGPAAASLGEHLVRRGQGAYAVSFYGPDDARLDEGLAHGARLEIVRDL